MHVSVERFHNREWLSTLMRCLKLTPLRAAAVVVLVNLLVDLPLAVRYDAFLPSAHSRGLLGEPADWIYEFLVHPVTLGYFCWLQTAGGQLLGKLLKNKLVITQKQASAILEKWIRRLQSPWVSRLATLASLLFAVWFVLAFAPSVSPIYPEAPYPSWVVVDPIIPFVRAPVVFVLFYALVIVIFDLAVIILALNDLLKEREVRVEPFHPDRAGGLGFVGGFAANLSYLIGAFGLLLFVRLLENPQGPIGMRSYVFFTGVILYLVLAPIIFFIPLWTTHLAMLVFRDDMLGEIADKMEVALGDLGVLPEENGVQTADEPGYPDAGRVKKLKERIENLNDVGEFLRDKVPVWPFNVGSLRRFYAVVASPVFSTVLVVIREFLFG